MTDKITITIGRDILEHTVVALEYAYNSNDEMVMESIRFLRHALAAQPAEPVAWINRRVIYDPATDSVTDYGEPELSFERASYGYDYANAKPLILAQQPAEAQPSPARELVAWKHDCAGLCANDVELWLDACPHCGKPRTTPPAQPAHTDGLAAEVWAIAQSPAPMADVLPVIAAALWASQPTEQALQKIADFGQDQEQQRPPHDPRR